jgi:hypothetical protein
VLPAIILKPRHSAFFATSLVTLLDFLAIKRLAQGSVLILVALSLPPAAR